MKDSFKRYRQKYDGGSDNTWKARLEMINWVSAGKIAFIQGNRELTWKEFYENVNRIGNALLELGVKKEDRIAIMGFNSIEWMEAYFGASVIGAVPVNVNPRFVMDEVRYILENSDSTILFLESRFYESVKPLLKELPLIKDIIAWKDPESGEQIIDESVHEFDELKKGSSSSPPDPEWRITNEDFCVLYYTGGTTGYPKGTVWDYQNRVRGLDMIVYQASLPILNNISNLPDQAYLRVINRLFPEGGLTVQELSSLSVEVLSNVLSGLYPTEYRESANKLARSLFQLIQKTPDSVIRKISELERADNEKRLEMKKIFRDKAVIEFVKGVVFTTLGTPLSYIHSSDLKLLTASPLFHGAGYEANFSHIGALGGVSIYLVSRSFNAAELWETAEKRGVNQIVIVGNAFAIPMVEELEKAAVRGRRYNLDSLHFIVSSGVRWSPDVKRKLLQFIPHVMLMDEIGTTESSAALTCISTSEDETRELKVRITREGPFPCRVINPETGKDAKPGEVGELVYGGFMALGYWKDPEKTAKSWKIIDGERWFFVGDEGIIDEEGYFHFIGRGASVINTGGEKVYPEEVEEVVRMHPKVRDAVVTGIPDERWGEIVTALVELRPGETANPEEIEKFCRGKMAGYKRPRKIIFVDKIPRTASGKLQRKLIKEIAIKLAEQDRNSM